VLTITRSLVFGGLKTYSLLLPLLLAYPLPLLAVVAMATKRSDRSAYSTS